MNVATIFPLWPGNFGLVQIAIACRSCNYGVEYAHGVAFGIGLQAIEASVGVGVGLIFLAREGLSYATLRDIDDDGGGDGDRGRARRSRSMLALASPASLKGVLTPLRRPRRSPPACGASPASRRSSAGRRRRRGHGVGAGAGARRRVAHAVVTRAARRGRSRPVAGASGRGPQSSNRAEAVGLPRLAPGELDPLRASTPRRRRAAARGARATARSAARLCRRHGHASTAASACGASSEPRSSAVPVRVACDVRNPLLGARGAARVFGPQKGADAGGRRRARGATGIARRARAVS